MNQSNLISPQAPKIRRKTARQSLNKEKDQELNQLIKLVRTKSKTSIW